MEHQGLLLERFHDVSHGGSGFKTKKSPCTAPLIDPFSQLGVPHAGRARCVVSHDHVGQGGAPGGRVEHLLGQEKLRDSRRFIGGSLKRRLRHDSTVRGCTLNLLRATCSRDRCDPLRKTSQPLKKNRRLNDTSFSNLFLQPNPLNPRETGLAFKILEFCPGGAPVCPQIPRLQDAGLLGLHSARLRVDRSLGFDTPLYWELECVAGAAGLLWK